MIASGGDYVVLASRPGATSARVMVTDGDGGEAEATATRVAAPVNAPPTAGNASATVVAGETVDIDLPARDPEGEPLEYEIVDEPSTRLAADARCEAGADRRRTSHTRRAKRSARSRSPTV